MAGLWVVGQPTAEGGLAHISAEVATLGRTLAEQAGTDVTGVVIAADPQTAAKDLATYVPRVLAVTEAATGDHAWATIAAERIAALARQHEPDYILLGADPDGRDLAGVLSVLLEWGVLVNATGVAWTDGGPAVEMSVFGGKLITSSRFTGSHGIVTVRPNVVTAEAAATPGKVDATAVDGDTSLPAVSVVDRITEAGAAAPIEEARVIVAGGRGIGGPDGFKLVEELADELGGAVGATRAAVDSGWINYSQQIGQTGKIVKPQLYLALGISGAIQHKVGMQTAETIVAVNRDPDAPIAEFADLLVVGDLFEVAPAILAELRSRSG
jgi:electron transfer flavoprotein alpha subunit